MMDTQEKSTRPAVLDIEPEDIVNGMRMYREQGVKCTRLRLFKQAIKDLDSAHALDPQDWRTVIKRARAKLLGGLFEEALEDAEMALEQDPEDIYALLLKSRALYEMGEFEQALIFSHRGWKIRKMPPHFAESVFQAEETIEDCIGRNVGPVMLNFLETIREMEDERVEEQARATQKEDNPCQLSDTDLSPTEMRTVSQRKRLARLDMLMCEKYLGRLAHDRRFLQRINGSPDLDGPNKAGAEELSDLVVDGLKVLQRRQEVLRERRPLYSIRYSEMTHSETLRVRRKEELNRKRAMVRETAFALLDRLHQARIDRNAKMLYDTTERARVYIDSKTRHLLPHKRQFLLTVYSMAALGYLDLRTFEPDADVEIRELQINIFFGLPVVRTAHYDAIVNSTVIPTTDYKKAMRTAEVRLEMAESPMERAWLYHEMARITCEVGRYDLARHYARKCMSEAKVMDNLPWCINAALVLAKTELHQHNKLEAKAAIVEGVEYAEKMKNEAVIEFLLLADNVIDRAELQAPIDLKETREKTILDLMADEQLREEATQLLRRIYLKSHPTVTSKQSVDFSHLRTGAHHKLRDLLNKHDSEFSTQDGNNTGE